MRSTVFAVAGALALLLLPQAGALAQDDSTTAAPKREAPAASLPKAPIPYAKLRPKPARPKPKPASTAAAATSGATTGDKAPASRPPPPAAVVRAPSPPPAEEQATPDAAPAAPPPRAPAAPPPPPAAAGRLSAGQPIPPAELEAFVDGMLKDAMAREHIAGATVAVVQNGQVVLKRGYGFAG